MYVTQAKDSIYDARSSRFISVSSHYSRPASVLPERRMTFFNFRLCRRNAQRWRRLEGNKTLLSACLLRRRRIGTCWQKHICTEPRFKAPCQVCLDSSLRRRRRRSGLRKKRLVILRLSFQMSSSMLSLRGNNFFQFELAISLKSTEFRFLFPSSSYAILGDFK